MVCSSIRGAEGGDEARLWPRLPPMTPSSGRYAPTHALLSDFWEIHSFFAFAKQHATFSLVCLSGDRKQLKESRATMGAARKDSEICGAAQ